MPRGKKKAKKGKDEVEVVKPGHKIAKGGVEVEYSADLMALAADPEFDWNEDLAPEQASQVESFIEMKRQQRRDLLSKGRDDKVAKHTSKLDNNILAGLSRYELDIRKRDAQEPFTRTRFKATSVTPPIEFPLTILPHALPIPTRPKWNKSMTKEQFLRNEEANFKDYLADLYNKHGDNLNYFEHNIEVWRQLWRCIEVSDIVLMMADIRFPLYHFPASVYKSVQEVYPGKPMMLALTKVDLVPQTCVDAWKHYFNTNYPLLTLVPIASYQTVRNKDWYQNRKQKKQEQGYNPKDLLKTAQSFGIKKEGELIWFLNEEDRGSVVFRNTEDTTFAQSELNSEEKPEIKTATTTETQIQTPATGGKNEYGNEFLNDYFSEEEEEEGKSDVAKQAKKKVVKNYVTIGLIGQPNVGKSTLINALKGSKVVSESSTPGHTKWRQTIFLNKDLLICDCPGLVFPFLGLPKELQVILGLYPLASLQDTWGPVRFLGNHLPLEKIYKLKKLEDDERWSPWEVTLSYAKMRDTYRASRDILSDILEGHFVLYTLPHVVSGAAANTEQKKHNTASNAKKVQSSSEKEDTEESDEALAPTNPYALLVGDDSTEEST